MASTYFTLPSFARAKKNQDELRRSNPQKPILNADDEKYLNKHIQAPEAQSAAVEDDAPATTITEDGVEKPATAEEQDLTHEDQLVLPETQPERSAGAQYADVQDADAQDAGTQDATVRNDNEAAQPAAGKKAINKKGFDLPSQEEAEATTRGWDASYAQNAETKDSKASAEKRTWASYLPAVTSSGKITEDKSSVDQHEHEQTKQEGSQRTWAQYASSYVPSQMPSLPAAWTKSKDKDAKLEPVYKEDGTIDEEKTHEKQEKEVSVLLDNLNMSTLNDRVFALSAETQKIYERFAQVLRDTIDGAPTAYDDMDRLMRDAGPQLEKQFNAMPPFVQTLVKALPSKIGASLAPELLAAAASEKPGADMKANTASADAHAAGSAKPPQPPSAGEGGGKAKKRKVPGLKGLLSQQGAVAGLLRNVVQFLRVRFPFLASTTNIVMSLAVFILMFVFYYCHKRGREVRLEKEKAAAGDGAGSDEKGDNDDNDEENDAFADEEEEEDDADEDEMHEVEAKLHQPDPAQVPLPAHDGDDDAPGARA